jgi:hypothetical protein
LSYSEQEDECKQHRWRHSIYCRNCGEYLEEWEKDVKKDTCIFLFVVLQPIINEQISIKQLRRETGSYIYQAVKNQCIRKGWIEQIRGRGERERMTTAEEAKLMSLLLRPTTIESLPVLTPESNDHTWDSLISMFIKFWREYHRHG